MPRSPLAALNPWPEIPETLSSHDPKGLGGTTPARENGQKWPETRIDHRTLAARGWRCAIAQAMAVGMQCL
jgi:hypothetical protein